MRQILKAFAFVLCCTAFGGGAIPALFGTAAAQTVEHADAVQKLQSAAQAIRFQWKSSDLEPLLEEFSSAHRALTEQLTSDESDHAIPVDSLNVLLEAAGEAFSANAQASGLRIADAVLALAVQSPFDEGPTVAWDTLSLVLLSSMANDQPDLFVVRAEPIISDSLEREANGSWARSEVVGPVLAAFSAWAPEPKTERLFEPILTVLNSINTGDKTEINNPLTETMLSWALLGPIPADRPLERVGRIMTLVPGQNDAVWSVVHDAKMEVFNGALRIALWKAELSDLTGSMATLQSLKSALPQLLDDTAGTVDYVSAANLAETVVSICAADSMHEAKAIADQSSALEGDYFYSASAGLVEASINQALIARGFWPVANERLRQRLTLAGDQYSARNELEAKIAALGTGLLPLAGFTNLMAGDVEAAGKYFDAYWRNPALASDGSPGFFTSAEKSRLTFAHALVSVGRGDYARTIFGELLSSSGVSPDPADFNPMTSEKFVEMNFLEARILFADGDYRRSLDRINNVRVASNFSGTWSSKGWPLRLSDALLGRPSFSLLSPMNPWKSTGDLPEGVGPVDRVPTSPFLLALAAADRLNEVGVEMTDREAKAVLNELRTWTRLGSTTVESVADGSPAGIPAEAGGSTQSNQTFFRRWNLYGQSVGGYDSSTLPFELALGHPCGTEKRALPTLQQQTISYFASGFYEPSSADDLSVERSLTREEWKRVYSWANVPLKELGLRPDEAILSVIGGGRDVYTIVVTSSRMTVRKAVFAAADPDLPALVRNARTAILEGPQLGETDRRALRAIAKLILWPAVVDLGGIKRLRVVTSGPISVLPLHLLRLKTDGDVEGDWIDEHYSLSYAPSFDAFIQSDRIQSSAMTTGPRSFFAVADPAFLGNPPQCESNPMKSLRDSNGFVDPSLFSHFCSVPSTSNMAAKIANVIFEGDVPDSSEWLISGEVAREPAVRSSTALADAKVLLFATHGLVSEETQKLAGLGEPALVLTPPAGVVHPPDGDDGLLTAREIASMKISATWVILVACNSAASDGAPDGDALSGLAHAFLTAGARGVIVSHWPLDANTAIGLVKTLLDNAIKQGMPVDQALRVGMQAIRNGVIYPGKAQRTEYSWAPFSVVLR